MLNYRKALPLAAFAAIVGVTTAAPATASPAAPQDDLSLTLCVDVNFGNCGFFANGSYPDLRNDSAGGHNFQDDITSLKNHTGSDMCFYADINFSGARLRVLDNSDISRLVAPFQDTISSARPTTTGTC